MASDSPVTPMMPHIVTPGYLRACGPICPRAASTTPASWAATASAWASSRASTMTRTSGSVPLGRSRTLPVVAQLGLGLDHRLPHLGAVGQALGSGDGDVDQALGDPLDQAGRQVGQRAPGPQDQVGQRDSGQDAVTGGRAGPEDDVPRLLATEAEAVGVERGQHVAVPHVGLAHRDAAGLHGQPEAEVGHDGDDHGVAGQVAPLGQVQREQRQQHVAVDDGRRCGRRR